MMKTEKFTFKPDHLKLLRRMYVGWQDCETGAPEIDPKRPYGNSFVAGDVAEILGWEWNKEEDFPEFLEEQAMAIHKETEHALQIYLRFGPEYGNYVKSWLGSWQKA